MATFGKSQGKTGIVRELFVIIRESGKSHGILKVKQSKVYVIPSVHAKS